MTLRGNVLAVKWTRCKRAIDIYAAYPGQHFFSEALLDMLRSMPRPPGARGKRQGPRRLGNVASLLICAIAERELPCSFVMVMSSIASADFSLPAPGVVAAQRMVGRPRALTTCTATSIWLCAAALDT